MKRWKLYIGITLIFALGVLGGSLGTAFFYKKTILPFQRNPKNGKASFTERLTSALDLTADQRVKFEKIVDELENKRRQYRSELREIRELAISQMKKEPINI